MKAYKGRVTNIIPHQNGSRKSFRAKIEFRPDTQVRYNGEKYHLPGFSANMGYLAKLGAEFYKDGNVIIPKEAIHEVVKDLKSRNLLKKVLEEDSSPQSPLSIDDQVINFVEEDAKEDSSLARPAITEDSSAEYAEPQKLENKVA